MAETQTIETPKATYFAKDGTKLNLFVSTEVKIDGNGKFVPNSSVTTLSLDQGGNKSAVVGTLRSGGRWDYTESAGLGLRQTLSNRNSMMNINLRNNIRTSLSRSDDTEDGNFEINEGINNNSTAQSALGGASIPTATEEEISIELNANLPSPQIPINLQGKVNIPIESKGVRTDYGPPLYYPTDIATNKQDRIKFSMKTNEGSIIRSGLGIQNIERRPAGDIKGSVTLPIVGGIQDSNSVKFNEGNLNPFQAFLVAGSMNIMESPTEELATRVGGIFGQAAKAFRNNNSYNNALKLYLAQEATSTQGLLSRATGAVLNPNLELLFDGPNLRDFSFVFRLSPRDETEASSVKKIIRFFKQGMSVKSTADATFLKTPNVFNIKYESISSSGSVQNHPSIGRIKTCALISCSVQYTPDGSYMTFADDARTLTSYELALQFKELTPVYEDDYNIIEGDKAISQSEIGY